MTLGSFLGLRAQNEVVIHDWTALEESAQHIDVSYRIVQCQQGENGQIQLSIFNENAVAKTISFSLEITDGNGESATIEFNDLSLNIGEMRMASCSDYPEITVDLPTNIDGSSANILIHYGE